MPLDAFGCPWHMARRKFRELRFCQYVIAMVVLSLNPLIKHQNIKSSVGRQARISFEQRPPPIEDNCKEVVPSFSGLKSHLAKEERGIQTHRVNVVHS